MPARHSLYVRGDVLPHVPYRDGNGTNFHDRLWQAGILVFENWKLLTGFSYNLLPHLLQIPCHHLSAHFLLICVFNRCALLRIAHDQAAAKRPFWGGPPPPPTHPPRGGGAPPAG